MLGRTLAVGIVMLLWVLAGVQVHASVTRADATLEWQIAGSVPVILIALYATGMLWSWLKRP